MENSGFVSLDQVIRWDSYRHFELLYRPKVAEPVTEDWWLRLRKGQVQVRVFSRVCVTTTDSSQDPDLCLRRISATTAGPTIYKTSLEFYESISTLVLDSPLDRRTLTNIPENFGIPLQGSSYLHFSYQIAGRETVFGADKVDRAGFMRPGWQALREDQPTVVIHIDTVGAIKSGIPFYTSKRGSLATPGNNGFLPKRHFKYVQIRQTTKKRVIDQIDRESWGKASHPSDSLEESSETQLSPHFFTSAKDQQEFDSSPPPLSPTEYPPRQYRYKPFKVPTARESLPILPRYIRKRY